MHAWIYTDNKLAKFHGNIQYKNIAKSFRGGATFLTHTVVPNTSNKLVFIRETGLVLTSRKHVGRYSNLTA